MEEAVMAEEECHCTALYTCDKLSIFCSDPFDLPL